MKKMLIVLALLLVYPVAYIEGDNHGDKVKRLDDLDGCVFEGAIAKFTDGDWTCAGDLADLQAQIDALDARITVNANGIAKNASDLAYIHP